MGSLSLHMENTVMKKTEKRGMNSFRTKDYINVIIVASDLEISWFTHFCFFLLFSIGIGEWNLLVVLMASMFLSTKLNEA